MRIRNSLFSELDVDILAFITWPPTLGVDIAITRSLKQTGAEVECA